MRGPTLIDMLDQRSQENPLFQDQIWKIAMYSRNRGQYQLSRSVRYSYRFPRAAHVVLLYQHSWLGHKPIQVWATLNLNYVQTIHCLGPCTPSFNSFIGCRDETRVESLFCGIHVAFCWKSAFAENPPCSAEIGVHSRSGHMRLKFPGASSYSCRSLQAPDVGNVVRLYPSWISVCTMVISKKKHSNGVLRLNLGSTYWEMDNVLMPHVLMDIICIFWIFLVCLVQPCIPVLLGGKAAANLWNNPLKPEYLLVSALYVCFILFYNPIISPSLIPWVLPAKAGDSG